MCKYSPQTGPHHFSDRIKYEYNNGKIIVKPKAADKSSLRMLDPWALAYKEWLEKQGETVSSIEFNIEGNNIDIYVEALKRRVSFLKIINEPFSFTIIFNSEVNPLYSKENLKPNDEIIRDEINERDSKDKEGRGEKDLQVFLFGGINKDNLSGEQIRRRLGILGEDFYDLKNSYKSIREFPTGVSKGNKKILPTDFIDFVTFNKHNEVSIIELKFNDSKT